MADSSRFPLVINVAYVIVLVLYLVFASAGYLMFGEWTLPEITANLIALAGKQYPIWLPKLCAALFVSNPLSKFGIVMEPVCRSAERGLAVKR
jgi:vesicular inhibitory amino acid transporter